MHFQVNMCTFILLIFLNETTCGTIDQEIISASVIYGVHRYFGSRCILLLHSNGQQDIQSKKTLASIYKYLAQQGILTTSMNLQLLRNSMHETTCQYGPSINVVLIANEETKFEIKKLFADAQSSRTIWIVFLNKDSSLYEFFVDINIPFDCEFLVAQSNGHGIALIEVYRISATFPLQAYPFGYWMLNGGLTRPNDSILKRRNDLQEHIIRATYVNKNFIVELNLYSSGIVQANGYFGQMWSLMAQLMNARTVYQKAHMFGYQSENGSWNGMMALVNSREVDIGLGDFSLTIERSKVVDFIDPLEISSTRIFIKLQDSPDLVWNNYLTPFSNGLWFAVVIAVCLLSFCLSLTNSYNDEENNDPNLKSIGAIFYVFGCLCQRGQSDTVKSTAGRTVKLTAYTMSFVLLAGYSASLISSLTIQEHTLPFKDLQGLLDDGSYKIGVLQNTAYFNMFNEAKDGVERTVYSKLIAPFKHDLPRTNEDGIARLCTQQKYVFIVSNFAAQIYSTKSSCKIESLPKTSYPEALTYIISKHNPYKQLISWNLARLRENGLQKRIRHRNVPKTLTDTSEPEISVGMSAVAPILIVFSGGILISLFLLIIERQIYSLKLKRLSIPYVRQYKCLSKILKGK